MNMFKRSLALMLTATTLSFSASPIANCIEIGGGHALTSENRTKSIATSSSNRVIKNYDYYKNLDPSKYEVELKDWYKRHTKKDLNLDNPQTFNEKIQWLKLYDSTPLKTRLADKYLVREWVKEKIGEEYLIPLLGVWDKFDDIDFDKLPDKFVLKCNHGCGWNLIVTDKSKLNKAEAKKKFDSWMNTNYAFCAGFELHYKNIKPKIIAEEYLENSGGDLYDYKVWCNNGNPEYVMFLSDRKIHLNMSFYDNQWNLMPFYYSHPQHKNVIPKLQQLNKLLEISKKLSTEFPHVRVDFYVLNDGSIKFGELTFTSCSGVCRWNEEKYNKMLGDKVILPKQKYDYNKLFVNNTVSKSNPTASKINAVPKKKIPAPAKTTVRTQKNKKIPKKTIPAPTKTAVQVPKAKMAPKKQSKHQLRCQFRDRKLSRG